MKFKNGLTIVEVVIASSIVLTVVVGASAAWQAYLRLTNTGTNTTEAILLTEEADEAIQFLRDTGWMANLATLSLNTNYYLNWTGSLYQLTTSPITNQNLTRTIVFTAVNRDNISHQISNSGSIDTDTLKATITIFPTGNATGTLMKSETLIHDVYDN